MRKQIIPGILFATFVLTCFFACKKKEDNSQSTTPATTGQQFACKIDGKEYAPNNGRYYAFPAGNTGFQIVGDTNTYTIELYIPATTTGTITLGDESTNNKYATVFFNDGSRHYTSTEGEIIITKDDGGKLSGTFHYKARDKNGATVDVTNGEFNAIEKKN